MKQSDTSTNEQFYHSSRATEAQEYEQQTEKIDAENGTRWSLFNIVFGIIAAWGAISLFGAIMLKLAGGD